MDSKSLFEFLGRDVQKVEIPRLQRDYAQGRNTDRAKEVRKRFTTELWKVITGKRPSLTLDLVYGYDEEGRFIPIDGQQRLTTLWLLHWYIAFRCGKFKEEGTKEILKKFTYETRVSSREFLSMLCDMARFLEGNQNPDQSGETGEQNEKSRKLSTCIKNQTWFRSSWIQDPTIKSMLTMIDRFDELWRQEETQNSEWGTSWDTLKSRLNNIKFYFADMKEWELGDDLYIKMNARGLPLTDYEEFKAALQKHQKDNKYGNSDEFNNWLDGGFLDFFWNIAKEGCDANEKPTPDRLMLEFINRYAIVRKILVTETKAEEGGKIIDAFPAGYNSFTPYEFGIDWMLFRKVFSFMAEDREEQSWAPSWERTEKEYMLPSLLRGDISRAGLCIFAAICIFVTKKPNDTCNSLLFKQWMRICWNVVENTSGMVSRIKLLNRLADKLLTENTSADLYGYIEEMIKGNKLRPEDIVDRNASEQLRVLREEFEKASEYHNYSAIIEAAEKRFKGSIFFLFASGYNNEDARYTTCWDSFTTKWECFTNYLDKTYREDRKDYYRVKWVNFCFNLLCHVQNNDEDLAFPNAQFLNYGDGIEKFLLTKLALLQAIHRTLTDRMIESNGQRLDGCEYNANWAGWAYSRALCHRKLLDYTTRVLPKARLILSSYRFCLYNIHGRDGIILGNYGAARTDTLCNLQEKGRIKVNEGHLRDDLLPDYLWGWHILFEYNGVRYLWKSNGEIRNEEDAWEKKKGDWRTFSYGERYYPGVKVTIPVELQDVIQLLTEEGTWKEDQ